MKKLEKLTTEQVAAMPRYVEEWTRIGLSCEPIDEARTRAAVDLCYACAGLKPPKLMIVADGPVSGAIIASLLKTRASVRASVVDSVEASVVDSVRASVWASVEASVRASVGASVVDSVWASVWASVVDSVWASVWASVGASVRDSVGASVRDSVEASVEASVVDSVRASVWASVEASVVDMLYASHWSNWSAWCAFFADECGVDTSRAAGHIAISRECGWWAAYTDVAIVQRRHTHLERDDRGRLHSETCMAVKYADGWGVWAINGTRVTEQIVLHPETLTVVQIKAEKNAEVRRVMRERFGEGRYLRETGARVIQMDHSGAHIGAAPRALMQDDEGRRFLVGTDGSTARTYYMEVPATVRTCREAHVALCGFDEARIVSEG